MKLNYLFSKLIKKIQIPAVQQSRLDNRARVASGSQVVNTTVGKYSYIGNFCTVIHAEIGSFCSIADNCIIGGAQHPIERVSTSPVFHEGKNILGKNFYEHKYNPYKITKIENDVWIGSNCLIKAGVTISNGAVIGMGTVLTKDVGPYEIWAGNPGRLIRKRFEDHIIKELLEDKWWDKSDSELKTSSPVFNDVNKYLYQDRGEKN